MLKEMRVAGITVDPFTNTPIVLLKDLEDKDVLPIWIGLLEASSIATTLENINTPRPMTHDLVKNILDNLGVKVVRVEVNDLKDNTYYALIHLVIDNKRLVIDSRPSDAIALAVRVTAPIFAEDSVLDKAGIILDQEPGKISTATKNTEKNSSQQDKIDEQELKKLSAYYDFINTLDLEDFGKHKS